MACAMASADALATALATAEATPVPEAHALPPWLVVVATVAWAVATAVARATATATAWAATSTVAVPVHRPCTDSLNTREASLAASLMDWLLTITVLLAELEAPRTEALKAHRSSATSAARRGARMASDHALRGLKVVG